MVSRFDFPVPLLEDGKLTEEGVEQVKKLLVIAGVEPDEYHWTGLRFEKSVGYPLKDRMIFVYEDRILCIET